jgi:hypothetical protein
MTWFDVLAPVMVIGLFALLFFIIAWSSGVSNKSHRRWPFPPTQRDIEATGRRRRWRRLTPWTEHPLPPS